MIYDALAAGHCFVGYDLPGPRVVLPSKLVALEGSAIMGDEISARRGVTLQAHLSQPAEIRLLKDGKMVGGWKDRQACAYSASRTGGVPCRSVAKLPGPQAWLDF